MTYKSILSKCFVLALVLVLMVFTSCEDAESETIVVPPCQTLNFGVLEVRFSRPNDAHRISVTGGGQTRVKISPMGMAVDTLQLTPGLYSVFINPYLFQQAPIEVLEDSITITQCVDSLILAPF